MARQLLDSEYIFGLHDPGGEGVMLTAGKPGWVLFSEAIGHDAGNLGGGNYTDYSNRNLGVLVRLNNGYAPEGTIPRSSQYTAFAQRCANFVANSQGCKIWLIGNEMNFANERPSLSAAAPSATPAPAGSPFLRAAAPQPPIGAPMPPKPDPLSHGATGRFNALHLPPPGASAAPAPGAQSRALESSEVITPELYVRCYRLCREAIHHLPGHADDQVLVGSPAPWNNQTSYPGNPNGDWVQYFQDILTLLGPTGCDGFTIHTYSHGTDPNFIYDQQRLNPPFQNRYYHFQSYRDFMQAVPQNMRSLPAYITETDQDDPWLDLNNGWVQRAYAEIDHWNKQPSNQQLRALILYRWPEYDRWGIERKGGVIEDFRTALSNDYRWRQSVTTFQPKVGDQVETLTVVNLRRTPGYMGKLADDVLFQVPTGVRLPVLSGSSRTVDNLTWWNVRATTSPSGPLDGWVAQTRPTGDALLVVVASTPAVPPPLPPAPTGKFKAGDGVVLRDSARLRQSPGYVGKPASDVVADLTLGAIGHVSGGPESKDNLTWWQVQFNNQSGWVAEVAPSGVVLLDKDSSAPQPPVPPPTTDAWATGDLVVVASNVRVRQSPGFVGKPTVDVLGDFAPKTTLNLLEGPRSADGLTWWRVGGIMSAGREITGWVAQALGDGTQLLTRARKLANSNIPDKASGSYLGSPFQGDFGIAQLWGENPQIYGQITYDGVPLKGHNGIDFLTPTGSVLLAVENGIVAAAVLNDPTGFGNYILIAHGWGESIYAHLQSLAVQTGQAVTRGQVIGTSNSTGMSFGPHLHFAIRLAGYSRTDGWGGFSDPLPYLPPNKLELPNYVLGLAPASTPAPSSTATTRSMRDRLRSAPGLAPERTGVRRP